MCSQITHVRKIIRVLSLSHEQLDEMSEAEREQVLAIRNNAVRKMRLAHTLHGGPAPHIGGSPRSPSSVGSLPASGSLKAALGSSSAQGCARSGASSVAAKTTSIGFEVPNQPLSACVTTRGFSASSAMLPPPPPPGAIGVRLGTATEARAGDADGRGMMLGSPAAPPPRMQPPPVPTPAPPFTSSRSRSYSAGWAGPPQPAYAWGEQAIAHGVSVDDSMVRSNSFGVPPPVGLEHARTVHFGHDAVAPPPASEMPPPPPAASLGAAPRTFMPTAPLAVAHPQQSAQLHMQPAHPEAQRSVAPMEL